MTRYRIENAVVTVLGFLVGVALALFVTSGDIVLWVMAGAALAIFSHAFFIRDLAGELFWPLGRTGHLHQKDVQEPKPAQTAKPD